VQDNGRRGEWRDDELWPEEESETQVESDDDPLLPKSEATLYRAVAARLNYLAPDRPDIGYSVKEAARAMSAPRQSHMGKIKKLGKYLKGRPRLVSMFKWQAMPGLVTTFTDSDWAGCLKSAKSTSGGVVCIGEHTIKTYSKQQKVVALSSAEAELYAMVLASAETMAVQAYAADLGLQLGGELYTDSSAALGIAKRAGIGKVRHLRTQGLWVQEVRVSGRISYKKVLGEKNPADLLTKYMTADLSKRHLDAIAAAFVAGRAESAPEIGSLEDTTVELNDDGGDGGLMSWIRKYEVEEGRRVRFRPSVSVRPIPAVGAGRSCKGPGGRRKRGQWPRESAASAASSAANQGQQQQEQQQTQQPESEAASVASIAATTSGSLDSGSLVDSKGEIEAMVSREEGVAASRLRNHDPQRGAAHTCGWGAARFQWKDAADDEVIECIACQEACRQLESPARRGRWRAKELVVSSLERGQETSEKVCAEVCGFDFGSVCDPDFVPVSDGHFYDQLQGDRSVPLGIELHGAAPLGDIYFAVRGIRASIESAIVRLERCTSSGNSCHCMSRCLSACFCWHRVGHAPKGERWKWSLSLALTRTHIGMLYIHRFVERCVHECIAMLPLTHADVQSDEPRLVTANAAQVRC
jgi:hypothetical protein